MTTPAPVSNATAVTHFWFGTAPDYPQRDVWFRKSDTFDAQIRDRFGPTIEAALAGGLHDWDATPQGRLARVVVLDQFTRNTFRGSPRAFAGDALALAAARQLVDAGLDHDLHPVWRCFAYLPFEHAEDLAMQERSVALFTALAAADARFDGNLDYAHRHHDVIRRYGRFPHRNAVLGRASTPDELAYLAQPGAGF